MQRALFKAMSFWSLFLEFRAKETNLKASMLLQGAVLIIVLPYGPDMK